MVVRLQENPMMVRVKILIWAMAGWAAPVPAQSVDKAIFAHTSESISLAPLLYGNEMGY
jgi:hypothetical protein